jgi:indolepyruvate decarboxylase
MFAAAAKHGLKPLITASDLEAGYAADGYARMRGIGTVCVTYGVGTLSLVSVIAGAYAERSPIIVLNGGPTEEDLRRLRQDGTLFSHSLGIVPPRRPGQTDVPEPDMLGDIAIFRRVCVHAVRITSKAAAAGEMDVPRATRYWPSLALIRPFTQAALSNRSQYCRPNVQPSARTASASPSTR